MSKEKKTITSEEFDLAVQLIADYKLQLDKELEAAILFRNQKINIQGVIKKNTFRVLKKYYQLHYAIRLQWEDLKVMDKKLLETMDYDKMKLIKGFGCMSLFNFKELTISAPISDKEEL